MQSSCGGLTWPFACWEEGAAKVCGVRPDRRSRLGLGRTAVESSEPLRCLRLRFREATVEGATTFGENIVAKLTSLADDGRYRKRLGLSE